VKIAYIVLKGMPLGGGIEKYTEEIGSRLAKRGHDVVVYAMKHYGAQDGMHEGMRIRSVPAIRSKSFEKMTAAFLATLNLVIGNNVDVVHFHAFGPAMFSFIPRLANMKVVVQGHGLEWKRSRWGTAAKLFLKMSEVPSVRFPHALTVVSRVQQDYIRQKYGRESIYIPTGVNPARKEEPDLIKQYGLRGNDYILFAGRLVSEKGARYLIDAFKKVKTDLKLVIAGDARHEAEYKAGLLKLAGETGNVIFPGFVTGKLLHEFFSNCYFFVLPSEIEGLSTVLLEAMSYGNCCLVSDIPENLEALHGHGYTFVNKDVHDLAEKMGFLIGHGDSVDRVKDAAKCYAIDNYSWDAIAGRFEDFYMRLLEGRTS